jgi:hypothetical protein
MGCSNPFKTIVVLTHTYWELINYIPKSVVLESFKDAWFGKNFKNH